MEFVKIRDICTFLPKSRIKAGEGLQEGIYNFFTSSDIKVLKINEYLFDDEVVILGTGGKPSCNYYNGKFSVSTDNFVLKSSKINIKYLYYFLRNNNLSILDKGFHGAGLKHISKDYVCDIKIPIIALNDQTKIVKELDLLNKNIELCNNQIQYLDNIIKSQFIEMFGRIEDSKNTIDLIDICVKITDGSHNPPAGIDKSKNYMISSQNIHDDIIDYKDIRFLSDEDFERENKRTAVSLGDVLLTIVGAIGRSAIVKDKINLTCQRSVCVIKPNTSKVNSIFLKSMLDDLSEQIINESRGVAQKGIYLNQVKKLQVICPSLEKQNKFADFVHQIDKSKYITLVHFPRRNDKV